MNRTLTSTAASLCMLALLCGWSDLPAREAPTVDQAAPDTPPVKKLPHKAGEPVAVTIYEFRSSINELPARGSTDMFITALSQNAAFHVVERSQLNQSVMAEKQLNAQGLSTGNGGKKKLRGAQYIFEGTISEANSSELQRSSSVGVAGMSVSGGSNRDVIAVDVRIVDASTGDVLDSITVRKSIKSDSKGVSGIGNLLSTVLSRHHADTTYTPDVNVQQQHKESLDQALRAVIAEAVSQLSARF